MFNFEANIQDVVKLILLGLVCFLLYQVKEIVALVFLAIIITSSLNPIVDYLEAKKIPRLLTIFCLVIVGGALSYLLLAPVVPNVVIETQALIDQTPVIIADLTSNLPLERIFNVDNKVELEVAIQNYLFGWLQDSSGDILKLGASVFDGFLSVITLIVLTFYLLADHGVIKEFFLNFASDKNQYKISKLWDTVEQKLGVWLRGQIFVMLIIGVITYLGLSLIGVQLALPLAIIAGLFEVIPIIGPILSAVPAIMIAATTGQNSTLQVVSVAIFYFIVQQLEGIFVVPKVMNQAVGLNPIVIILAVTIGSKLGGPLGALLAVPIAVVLYIGLLEVRKTKSK